MHQAVNGGGGLCRGCGIARAIGAGQLVLQLGAAHFQHLGRAIENLAAQIGALLGPVAEGAPRRHHGVTKILFRGAAEICQDLATPSLSGEDTAIFSAHELAADKKFIGFLNL